MKIIITYILPLHACGVYDVNFSWLQLLKKTGGLKPLSIISTSTSLTDIGGDASM